MVSICQHTINVKVFQSILSDCMFRKKAGKKKTCSYRVYRIYRWLCTLVLQMWLWTLVGLSIITKVCGYASGYFPEVCHTMSPRHKNRGEVFAPQNTQPPFEVRYEHGKKGDPITGTETFGWRLICHYESLLQWSFTKRRIITVSIFSTCVLINLRTIFQFFSRASHPHSSGDLCWRLETKAWWTMAGLLENLSCLTLVILNSWRVVI